MNGCLFVRTLGEGEWLSVRTLGEGEWLYVHTLSICTVSRCLYK